LTGAAADLQDSLPADIPEQVGLGFADTLGGPQEVSVAEVAAVFFVVFLGLPVPPPAPRRRVVRVHWAETGFVHRTIVDDGAPNSVE
jgi:hypothetical protein